jgi:hypothetical protein
MYWNHRLVDLSEDNEGEPWLEIQEVYYNDKDEPCGYCDPCVGGEDLNVLREQIERFAKCIEQPILKKTDFVGKLTDENEGEW